MKIADSSIAMSNSRTYVEKYEKSESLRFWAGNTRPDFEGKNSAAPQSPELVDYLLELSEEGKKSGSLTPSGKTDDSEEIMLSGEDELKILLVEKMIEFLTGKKIKISVVRIPETCKDEAKVSIKDALSQQPPAKAGWGLEYDYHEMRYEHEETSFTAQGIVRTADGKEINFSVSLNMSRTFMQEQNISIRAGDALKIDPLVINFNGKAAELTTQKFSFDLDSDGKEDQVSFAGKDAGFLALDLNEDGIINNGSELFGPNTGNGFTELAQYDKDENRWIDENDPIFSKLRIWTKDAQGHDSLLALGQTGVGAIYLGHIPTPFDIKSGDMTHGQLNKSGIYIREDGTPGTIQQIDLTI